MDFCGLLSACFGDEGASSNRQTHDSDGFRTEKARLFGLYASDSAHDHYSTEMEQALSDASNLEADTRQHLSSLMARNPKTPETASLQDIWLEIAEEILTRLESIIRAVKDSPGVLGPILEPRLKVVEDAAMEVFGGIEGFIREHRYETAWFVTMVAIGLLVPVAPWVIRCLGFGRLGPVADSFAAAWQTTFPQGRAVAGSVFSFLQRLGMTLD